MNNNDHVFVGSSYPTCKYCGLKISFIDLIYNICTYFNESNLPKCLSDEQKIIKDILE